MTQLRDLLDLPERIQKSQFVVTLEKGVGDPASVIDNYAVTTQIHEAYDQALGYVKVALSEHQNVASYLHGSFGSGKSHFMALLSLMLANDTRAWQNPALHDLYAQHSWLRDKRILRLHFNMIDAASLEDRIFKGYLTHLKLHHPEAPLPAIFKDAGLFENALELRNALGDGPFFSKLNQARPAVASAGWGKLTSAQAWDGARFDAACSSDDPTERARLLTDLTRTHFPAFREGHQGFVAFEDGMGILCAHARAVLGVDALVLFLDELILWLSSIAADKARLNREVPKLSRLVERNIAAGEVPVVTFAARQRDIAEMVGEEFIGPEHETLRTALAHWHGRFNEIKLGDKNLPEIVEKRVVRAKDDAARAQLNLAFDKLRGQLRGNSYSTLLGGEGDEKDFRRVYPFSPALVETLVALSHLLQRERTALKVLMELLVEHLPKHMPDFQLGQVIPVGELWDVLADGEEPMDGSMKKLFRQAKRIFEHELLPVLSTRKSDNPRADQRLVKTLILATLVPNVPVLKNLTVSRLVQLNHGSLRTLIPGGEVQKASTLLREWAASIHNLRVGEGEDPSVSLVLDDVDISPILQGAQNYNTEGARKGKLKEILYNALGLEGQSDNLEHKVLWRGRRCIGSVFYGNIREVDDAQLKAHPGHDFRLVIDYPFDRAGHGPTEDEARLSQFTESGLSSPTIAWLPSFFGEKVQRALGELVVIDRILEGDNYKSHMQHLRDDDQRRARTGLEHLQNQKRAQVRKALAVAYGLRAQHDPHDGDLDEARSIERHFFSLYPDCTLRTPQRSELSRTVEAAVSELMEVRYPRHPRFDPEDRAVTVGQLEKAFVAFERVCSQPEQRLAVAKRELGEYMIPERVQLLDLSEAHVGVRRQFHEQIDQRLAAQGISTPDVRHVKREIDPDHVFGYADEVLDFIVLCYATVSHRELLQHGRAVTEYRIGKLGDDWELVRAPLPSMAAWTEAVDRAGALFGVTASRARNVRNLREFSEKLSAKVKDARDTRHADQVAGELARRAAALGATGPRIATAEAVRDLLALLNTRDPVAQVEALAAFSPRTSLQAMHKHLDAAPKTLAVLAQAMVFEAFEALGEVAGEQAAAVLTEAREALSNDELHEALAVKLEGLGVRAQRLLRPPLLKATTALVPPSITSAETFGVPTVEAHAAGRVEGLSAAELAATLDTERAKMADALAAAGPGATLSLSWQVRKG